jgi:hypothetical protein
MLTRGPPLPMGCRRGTCRKFARRLIEWLGRSASPMTNRVRLADEKAEIKGLVFLDR